MKILNKYKQYKIIIRTGSMHPESTIMNRKINVAIIAAILVICAVFAVVRYYEKRYYRHVDISEYIDETYTGLDGRGRVSFTVDTDSLYKKLAGEEKNSVVLERLKDVIDSIAVTTTDEKLSNGDRLKVKVSYDSELAERFECRFKKTEFRVKVNGLGQGIKVDIFKNIEVVVAGVSPQAYAAVTNKWTEEPFDNIPFSIENPVNISKGDTITVKCDASEEDIMQRGYIFESFEKEYKVDRVNCYASEVSQFDDALLLSIKDEAIKTIQSETENLRFRMFYKASNDSSYLFQFNKEWVNSTELTGAYALFRKKSADGTTPDDGNEMNSVCMIFKSNISNETTSADIYFAFVYKDGIITTEGNFTIPHDNQALAYICSMSAENVLNRSVSSKAEQYEIVEIDGLK